MFTGPFCMISMIRTNCNIVFLLHLFGYLSRQYIQYLFSGFDHKLSGIHKYIQIHTYKMHISYHNCAYQTGHSANQLLAFHTIQTADMADLRARL